MKVGLFIPCYVDAVYPEVGMATYKLLKHLGIDVTYPQKQTCCGQPMANAGFEKQAIPLAEKFEVLFKDFDYVVAPASAARHLSVSTTRDCSTTSAKQPSVAWTSSSSCTTW